MTQKSLEDFEVSELMDAAFLLMNVPAKQLSEEQKNKALQNIREELELRSTTELVDELFSLMKDDGDVSILG